MGSGSSSHKGMMPQIKYNNMMEPVYEWIPINASKPKISDVVQTQANKLFFGIFTHDVEPYLWYTLKNIYGAAVKIVVIEGYVKECWDLPFSDYTQRVVARVDTDKKVLYQHVGRVVDKYHLAQKALDILRTIVGINDLIIMMGADEAWSHGTIRWLEGLDKDVLWAGVPFDNFYGDFRHILVKPWTLSEEIPSRKIDGWVAYDREDRQLVNEMYQERVFRYRDGFNYAGNHVSIKDGQDRYIYSDQKYQGRRIFLAQNSVTRWAHYGYVGCRDWLSQKIRYYLLKGGKVTCQNVYEAVRLDHRYRYAETGNELVFDGNDNKIVEVQTGYVHPWPMGTHPYASMTRDNIFNSKMSLLQRENAEVDSMKIVAVIPTYKRKDVTVATIRYLSKQSVPPDEIVLVGSSQEDVAAAEEAGCHYVNYPNDPLSEKIQAGIYKAREFSPDAILLCGSDDWLSLDWIERFSLCLRTYDVVGHGTMNLLQGTGGKDIKIIEIPVYMGTSRRGEPIGAGRMISRRILDKIDWNLYREKQNTGCDGGSFTVLKSAGAKVFMCEEDNPKLLCPKGVWRQINSMDECCRTSFRNVIGSPNEWMESNFHGLLWNIQRLWGV